MCLSILDTPVSKSLALEHKSNTGRNEWEVVERGSASLSLP